MASLLYLKHSFFNFSDEDMCERWSKSPMWQVFSGMDDYGHRLACDATQSGCFRHDIGEDRMVSLLKATIHTPVAADTVKPEALERVYNVFARLLLTGQGFGWADGHLTAFWAVGTSAGCAALYWPLGDQLGFITGLNILVSVAIFGLTCALAHR